MQFKRLQRPAMFLTLLLAIVLGLGFQSSNNNFGGPGERLVGGPICLSAAGNTLGPMNIQGVPTGSVIRNVVEIPGYGAPGDTLAYRFNGDTGNNYRYWFLTAAPGGTTFAPGAVANTTDRIKLGAADTQNPRLIETYIMDVPTKAEKLVLLAPLTGTGAVGTQANIDLGNGAWFSGANTPVTSITLFTSTANMAKGTCMTAYAR